jgi:secreted trypsin-like serine protease
MRTAAHRYVPNFAWNSLFVVLLVLASRLSDATPEIYNGKNSCVARLPWMAALTVTRGGNWYRCAGVVIAPNAILTAAHCVTTVQNGVPTPDAPANIGIQAGVTDLRDAASSAVLGVTVHPNYLQSLKESLQQNSMFLYPYDLAVLKVNQTYSINQIAPFAVNSVGWTDNARGIIAGWGMLGSGNDGAGLPAILQEGVTTFLRADECRERYRQIANNAAMVTNDKLCAISLPTDVCKGDSGGGLFLLGKQISGVASVDTVSLIGIVSNSPDGKCGQLNSASLYSDVSQARAWIESQLDKGIKLRTGSMKLALCQSPGIDR